MANIIAYEFFRNALLGGLLVSILCAMVGTYVVTRRMVIVGGGMAHASLGGVGLGAYLGFSPLLGAALFAVFSGYSIDFLSRRKVREDAAIAMLWTLGMSLGILFAYLTPGFMTDLPSYLFGNILFITREDLWLLLLLVVAVGLFFGLLLTPIVTIAYDRDFAVTQGLPVRWIEALMILFMALTLVVSLRMVGIVLVISLLSVPQQTAAIFCRTFRSMMLCAGLFAFSGIVCGLWASALWDLPGGACITICMILQYGLCRFIKAIKTRKIS